MTEILLLRILNCNKFVQHIRHNRYLLRSASVEVVLRATNPVYNALPRQFTGVFFIFYFNGFRLIKVWAVQKGFIRYCVGKSWLISIDDGDISERPLERITGSKNTPRFGGCLLTAPRNKMRFVESSFLINIRTEGSQMHVHSLEITLLSEFNSAEKLSTILLKHRNYFQSAFDGAQSPR